MKQNDYKKVSRRDFFKIAGTLGVATSSLIACNEKKTVENLLISEKTDDRNMTYRINPSTGDKVSLLGFGMMRLPLSVKLQR